MHTDFHKYNESIQDSHAIAQNHIGVFWDTALVTLLPFNI